MLVLCLGVVSLQSGCRATGEAKGESAAEQQSTIRSEQSATLNQLYAARPELRAKVQNAAGHAFFSNLNVNVLLLSTENGYGVVHDNGTGKDTFMKMAGAGAGLGMGVKDYRVVFIFTDPAVMRRFVDSGWDFGGQADASAKTGETGAAASGTTTAGAVAGPPAAVAPHPRDRRSQCNGADPPRGPSVTSRLTSPFSTHMLPRRDHT